MTSPNTHHGTRYTPEQTEAELEHAQDYHAFLDYANNLADNHPEVFDDMALLMLTNGDDVNHWQRRFQEADLAPAYTYAFSQATKDLDDEHRDDTAHYTAALLTKPLEAQLNHLAAQRLLSISHDDPLDPESHRLILAYTSQDTTQHMNELRQSIKSALAETDRQELSQALNDVAYLIHKLDYADTIPEPEASYQSPYADLLRDLSQHRTDLMDQRFKDYVAVNHPNLEGASPSDESFQETFHTFTSNYRDGDRERLARLYATQAATTQVPATGNHTLYEYRSAWSSHFSDIYMKLAYPSGDSKPDPQQATPHP